jgi:hypothetical protein
MSTPRYNRQERSGETSAAPAEGRVRLMVANVSTIGTAEGTIMATIMTDHIRNVMKK